MAEDFYYVKSLEEDFATKTLKGKDKVTYQTVQDIVKKRLIKPNTKSFGRRRRLSCTLLSKNYTKTYRPHGIIFQTEQKPDHILPFDLVLLSATDKIVVHYYRIKNNLHLYYNHKLIDGFDKFIFKNFDNMIKSLSSPSAAWSEVNEFREKHGYAHLPGSKYRLVEYNEAVFQKPIKIKPVALFGYRPETRIIAKELGLRCFRSAMQFYDKMN